MQLKFTNKLLRRVFIFWLFTPYFADLSFSGIRIPLLFWIDLPRLLINKSDIIYVVLIQSIIVLVALIIIFSGRDKEKLFNKRLLKDLLLTYATIYGIFLALIIILLLWIGLTIFRM